MKIAFVEPVHNVGFTSVLTDVTLINVQNIDKNNKSFLQNLLKFKSIIIDNGVFEMFHSGEFDGVLSPDVLKEQESVYRILQKYADVKVVLPDFPFDFKKTIEIVSDAMIERKWDYIPADYMCVVQGDSLREIEKCCKFYCDFEGKIVAIPIRLRQKFPRAYNIVKQYFKPEQIHLLGFDLSDLANKQMLRECRSMDTSYPIKCWLAGVKIGEDVKRSKDYLKSVVENEKECLDFVKKFLVWLRVQVYM